jgi:ribonuclease HI
MAAFYVLNVDASVDRSRKGAIGVVLRQKPGKRKPLKVIAFLSKKVDTDDITEAEYLALIEGLRLAARHEITTLRVFTDSDVIPQQINASHPRFSSPALKRLYDRAWRLINRIGKERVKVLWVPREMNTEADQRAADAFFERKGDAWFRPPPT